MEWRVSLVPVPAITGTVTASDTARQSSPSSASERTGPSPVVPATTSPSLPWSGEPARQGDGPVDVEIPIVVERRDHGGDHRAEPAGSAVTTVTPSG